MSSTFTPTDGSRANVTTSEIPLFEIGSLVAELFKLKDRRCARGKRYSLVTLLTLMLLGKLAGQDRLDGIAEWAQLRRDMLTEMLGLIHPAMPHVSTFERLARNGVEVHDLERTLGKYFAGLAERHANKQICIDGKQVRGTLHAGASRNVYLLGAFMPSGEIMLMQVQLDEGEGEQPAAVRVLRSLDLRDCVVTGDAAFAQRALSVAVLKRGGEYLWKLKDNQPKLLEDVKFVFAPERPALPGFSNPPSDLRSHTETRTGHGRVERRSLTASSLLKGHADWPGLEQVFKIDVLITHKKSGRNTSSLHFGITSLSAHKADPARLLHLHNSHWGIESKSHWRRDNTFGEDACRLKLGTAAHLMAILNNVVIALLALASPDLYATSARRRFDACPQSALRLLHAKL